MPIQPPPPVASKTNLAGKPLKQVSPLEQIQCLARNAINAGPRFCTELFWALIERPDLFDQVRSQVPEPWIPCDSNKFMLRAFGWVADFHRAQGLPMSFTMATVYEAVKRQGQLEEMAHAKVDLNRLEQRPRFSPADAEAMLASAIFGLRDTYTRTIAVEHAASLIEMASRKDVTGATLLDRAQANVDACRQAVGSGQSTVRDMTQFAPGLLDEPLGAYHPTHLPLLDKILHGFGPSTLTVFGGANKSGKSALLLGLGLDGSMNARLPVLYLDTEMSADQQQVRVLANLMGVDSRRLIGNRDPAILERKAAAEAMLAHAIFHHDDGNTNTPEILVAKMRAFRAKYPDKCLIILDYLKVTWAIPPGSNEYRELGILTDAVKRASKDLNCPIITAAQLNVKAEGAGQMDFVNLGTTFLADSQKIVRFADNFVVLRDLNQAEQERVKSMGLRSVDDDTDTRDTLRFNQVAHVLRARSSGSFTNGIPLFFNHALSRHVEMAHTFSDEAAGIRAVDERGKRMKSPEITFLHHQITKSVRAAKTSAKDALPSIEQIQAAQPTEQPPL
jgi:replicative DNA helicase